MLRQERKRTSPAIGVGRHSAMELLAVFFCGLLIGRVNLRQTIYPFGAAYMLAAYQSARGTRAYVAAGGVFGALALGSSGMQQPGYHFSVAAVCAALVLLAECLQLRHTYGLCCGMATCAYTAGLLLFRLDMLLSVAATVLELAVCLLMIYILDKAFSALEGGTRTEVLSDEQLIGVCFCGLLCVMGLGDLGVAGIYIRDIVCAAATFSAAYAGGAPIGAAAGAAAAFACTVAGTPGLYVSSMGLLGVAAGICKRYGKLAVLGGGSMAAALGVIYLGQGDPSWTTLAAAGLGGALFACIPTRILQTVSKYVDAHLLQEQQWELKQARFRELTEGRLTEAAALLTDTASLLRQTAKTPQPEQISYAIAEIPEQACRSCAFYRACWHEDFSRTYELMQQLYAAYREKGELREKDMGGFARKCLRTGRLLTTAKGVFERFELNSRWEQRLAGSREAVAMGMQGTGKVLRTLAQEVQTDIRFSREMGQAVRQACDKALLDVREVSVTAQRGIAQVDLLVRTQTPEAAEYCALKAVSEACDRSMRRSAPPRKQQRAGFWRFSFETGHAFSVQIGAANTARSGSDRSGDAHSHELLPGGRYMLLLCDGMGSGSRAAAESRLAVSLIENFYKVGYEEQEIMELLNKLLLLLSGSDDIYSTLDLAMLDLVEGTARFIKIGAPHSYIVGERGMRKLKAGTLPMGILEEYAPVIYEAKLEPGDTILMFTDGIADLEDTDDALHAAIRKAARLRNAGEAAESILAAARKAGGGKAADDMTVLAARVLRPGGQAS